MTAWLCMTAAPTSAADNSKVERVKVTDPYIELHTGPGRGFPIFHVAGRDEWIDIQLRHTDWFKVRTASGKEGWVTRQQLETTLTDAGTQKTFRDVLFDDYLKRRVELGAGWGRFKSEPMLKALTSYRLGDNFSLEGSVGQVQGVFSGTTLWHLNVLAEPMADRRLSPFFGIGVGKFNNIPNASLVDAETTRANLGNAMVGLRYHLSDRFVVRTDYTIYTVFISGNRTNEYRALTVGLSFFF